MLFSWQTSRRSWRSALCSSVSPALTTLSAFSGNTSKGSKGWVHLITCEYSWGVWVEGSIFQAKKLPVTLPVSTWERRVSLTRQPIAVSDISIYICLIDISFRSKSKEQLNERRAGLSSVTRQPMWPIWPIWPMWPRWPTWGQWLRWRLRLIQGGIGWARRAAPWVFT